MLHHLAQFVRGSGSVALSLQATQARCSPSSLCQIDHSAGRQAKLVRWIFKEVRVGHISLARLQKAVWNDPV
jgi:hypothetical protein